MLQAYHGIPRGITIHIKPVIGKMRNCGMRKGQSAR